MAFPAESLRVCPKCNTQLQGQTGIPARRSWVPGTRGPGGSNCQLIRCAEVAGTQHQGIVPEHLHRECPTCGYMWAQACADQPAATPAPTPPPSRKRRGST